MHSILKMGGRIAAVGAVALVLMGADGLVGAATAVFRPRRNVGAVM
jgi:hypothetical protein